MRTRMPVGRTAAVVVSGALVGALALSVVILSVLALGRAAGTPPTGTAAPPPTFSFTPRPGTETPTAPPTPVTSRSEERLLAVGGGAWWRATAGACGGDAPLVERSTDQGGTWSDVTPRYRDVRQVRDLVAFGQTEADIVVGLGDGCATQLLRTYTQGRFWDPDEEILAASTYPGATGVILDGRAVEAPCTEPRSLRAAGGLSALVCDGTAYRHDGVDWLALDGDGILALDVWDGAIVGATTSGTCEGLALVRLDTSAVVGCVPGDPAAPTAVALTSSSVAVWNGDAVTVVAR